MMLPDDEKCNYELAEIGEELNRFEYLGDFQLGCFTEQYRRIYAFSGDGKLKSFYETENQSYIWTNLLGICREELWEDDTMITLDDNENFSFWESRTESIHSVVDDMLSTVYDENGEIIHKECECW